MFSLGDDWVYVFIVDVDGGVGGGGCEWWVEIGDYGSDFVGFD